MVLGRKNLGFTMIEALIVVTTIGILGAMVVFATKLQIAKGRDGRRKADLTKIQKALEDYMNDKGCYPDILSCGVDFKPYLSLVPCDPINNSYFNYFYSYDQNESCKSWYKIYTRLEYTKDPIIEKVGCKNGCGPSKNYNYWVSSPNVNRVEQTSGELWWPDIGGGVYTPTLTPTPTPPLTPSVTPTSTPTPTPTLPGGATSTPTPTPDYNHYGYYGCFSRSCNPIWGNCGTGNCQCPNINYLISDCEGQCSNSDNECR
jgi:type II secretory pathway pseudopilin PulG